MGRSKKLNNRIWYAAALLLCLTAVSVCAMGRLYARYTAGVSASDQARVARFAITEAGELTQQIEISGMQPGDQRFFSVTVTSNSEVTVAFRLAVVNEYQNLPLTFALLNSAGEAIDAGTIAANDNAEKTYTLRVTWGAEEKNPDYAGRVDVLRITLTAEQVD